MKKLYKSVSYEKVLSGFALRFDGKPARTPAGNPFILQGEALALAVTKEWQGQGETLRKDTMPLAQLACVAIDLAGARREEVIADILPYGETDLVCYRAGDIPALAKEQAEMLDPIMAWAGGRFGITLHVTHDMMPIAQPEGNKAKLAQALSGYDDWRLAALAASVKALGSLVLALALTEGHINAEEAFHLSHLEESYETRQWGDDEEKENRMRRLKEDIAATERFLSLLLSSQN